MDRIRKALDLARQERNRSSERESPAPPTTSAKPSPPGKSSMQLPARIEYTNTRVFTPNPQTLESKRIVNPSGSDPAAAAFRMLRTQVLQRMDANGWRTLAVMSAGRNDGKTTTAINLAISLANDHHHTVLLVDCDLKQPTVGANLGIEAEYGLDDILRGEAEVEQCLYHPEGYDRLVVLPARGTLANSSEALAGPRGRALIADIRNRYPERIMLFDLPPVLGADDALAFLPSLDCGLIVVAERGTRRDDLLRCMELLRKTPILGTVLNKATDVAPTYG